MISQRIMGKEPAKNAGPSCACGKVDLYEEIWKNEKKKKEAPEAPPSEQSGVKSHAADSAGQEN
jgi:hypothetical protein